VRCSSVRSDQASSSFSGPISATGLTPSSGTGSSPSPGAPAFTTMAVSPLDLCSLTSISISGAVATQPSPSPGRGTPATRRKPDGSSPERLSSSGTGGRSNASRGPNSRPLQRWPSTRESADERCTETSGRNCSPNGPEFFAIPPFSRYLTREAMPSTVVYRRAGLPQRDATHQMLFRQDAIQPPPRRERGGRAELCLTTWRS
jgi:hypothetical protein